MVNKKEVLVPILDQNDCFLSNTSSAKARILMRSKKAFIFQKDPFILKMRGEENTMSIKKHKPANFIKNFTNYFREEKEVYVQNMSASNISMTLQSPSGDIYLSIARTRKPMNLTMYAPFEVIKQSTDFRKLVNRNPPVLNLLTEDQFTEYYEKDLKGTKLTLDDAMRNGQEIHDILLEKRKPKVENLSKEMEDQAAKLEEEMAAIKEPNPRIVGLCAQAGKDQKGERIQAKDFLEELEVLETELTEEDYEFVSARGVYPTIKSFAASKLAALTDSDDE